MTKQSLISPFSIKPLVQFCKCDLCMEEKLCVYIEQIDKWCCVVCIEVLIYLLEFCDCYDG